MSEQVILYQPPGRPWGAPNFSPFCIKLETYLRLAQWPYECRAASFRKAPKGKVPYIDIGGALLGDSQLVIEYLEARRPSDRRLDAWLDDSQRAVGHAARRMLDEGLYFVMVYLRWLDERGWETYRPAIGQMMGPFRHVLPLVRRAVRKATISQGTGRHSAAEVAAAGVADLRALSQVIGDHQWLLGDARSTYDASAFAFIEAIAAFPVASPVRDFLLADARLTGYRQRVRAAIWSDLPVVS